MSESATGTAVSPSFITDASGGVWGLGPSQTSGMQVVHNGAIDKSTRNVAVLYYTNHGVYQKNTAGQWYLWKNSKWNQTSDPTAPVLIESPDGTTVTTVGPAIVDSNLTAWTLVQSATQGLQIAANGVVDPVTQVVIKLYYTGHVLYQENQNLLWWAWKGGAWVSTADPTAPPPQPGVIPYGTSPPASLPTVTGAVSPLGWNVSFFEDFLGPLKVLSTSGASWGQGQCSTGTNTWDFVICWGGGNGQSNLNRNNLSLANSVATFKVTADSSNISGAPFSGCGITNASVFNRKWGYWEFNMKMPLAANGNQNGLWGIGWLTAMGNNWPQEVDVFEQLNAGNSVMPATLHYGASSSVDTPVSMSSTLPFDSTAGFHTYGCLVCPNYIALYADGQLMNVRYRTGMGSPAFNGLDGISGSGPTAVQATRYHYSYDFMQTIVGAYCGQSWNPNVTAAQLPCQLQCDWIRYSELNIN